MIRKNKRLIRLFITFSFLFLVLVVLISNAYNNNIYKVNQNNYVNNQTTNVKKAINNALINDYKLVSDNLIDNNDINSFYLYGGSQIDEIISINDNLLNYNDSSYLINNDLYKNNYAFFKLNDILKDDVNDFPILQQGDIIGLNNQSTLFYFTPNSSTTNCRFGRNMSGGYSFSVVTPKHRPTSPIQNETLIVNKRYNYEMYMVPRELTNTLDWHTNIYKLPKLAQEGYQGYHYHVINPSQNPIIRELAIVILSETADPEWGLNDEFGTWD